LSCDNQIISINNQTYQVGGSATRAPSVVAPTADSAKFSAIVGQWLMLGALVTLIVQTF